MKALGQLKISICILVVIVAIFLSSPWIALFLPVKLKDHAYAEVTYQVIADKETEGVTDEQQQVNGLFNYVRMNIFLPQNASPYSGKPLDYLTSGVGWCDYMSKALNCLLAKKGIASRYAMLFDKQGSISIHTLNEIFIDGKWAVFDPLMGVIFHDDKGGYLKLEEITDTPSLMPNNPRIEALQRINRGDYYGQMFPVMHQPQRSEPRIKDLNIFDNIASFYAHLFKENFTYFYQDTFLKLRSKKFKDDYRLYYLARNYHLYYRFDLSREYYNAVINGDAGSKYRQDAMFFLGLLYINVKHDYAEGIKTLNSLLLSYPDTRWVNYAYFYLGKANEKNGDPSQAYSDYRRADIYKLDDEEIDRIGRERI